jgi:DNA-binding NarL/FixJ family response regulator
MAKHVLIVDDSDQLRQALRTALETKLGVTCTEARNGRDAVNRALELNPDLIVLDLSMPVMSGLDAALHLKRLLPAVPIVMFTTFNGIGVLALALAAGIATVVGKESPDTLVAAVRTLISIPA